MLGVEEITLTTSLEAIFDSYDNRKRTELEAAEHGTAKTKAEIEQGFAALRETVLPVLRRLEAQIAAKGHKAKTTEKLGDTYPAAVLEFTPEQRTKGPPFHVASRIAFSCYGGAIETKPEIGATVQQAVARIRIEELSEAWVIEQVGAMVAAALEKA